MNKTTIQSLVNNTKQEMQDSCAELGDEELKAILTAIYQRYKYDYRDFEPLSLKRRIHTFMRKSQISDIHALWRTLLHDQDFALRFNSEISVGLTFFFRDFMLWDYLKTKHLPTLKGKAGISVWHAGCSTGEEVYSMALLLEQLQLRQKTKTHASDINYQFIKHAKEGRYAAIRSREFESHCQKANIDPQTVKRFSSYEEDGGIRFDPLLSQNIIWEQKNIITDEVIPTFDIIFCRNVLIYFNKSAKKRVLQKFARQLNPGGILILGFFDSLMSHHFPEELIPYELHCKIYRKPV